MRMGGRHSEEIRIWDAGNDYEEGKMVVNHEIGGKSRALKYPNI